MKLSVHLISPTTGVLAHIRQKAQRFAKVTVASTMEEIAQRQRERVLKLERDFSLL